MARRAAPSRAARPAAGLDRLWAPWRMPYIRTADRPDGCLFCRVRASRADRPHLVLARRGRAFLMMNRFPYTSGHLMVAVARHAPDFASLTEPERADLLALVALAERALEAEYHPHGMNVGANLGRVAGAGFPGHLHLHLVPRWDGDTNFMPVVGQTRVLPESLDATWRRLRRSFAALERRAGATPGRRRPVAGRAASRGTAGRGRARGRRA
jgi:ATP adenylyltransferase